MVWYTFGPEPRAVYALNVAVTTLIIACPCALGMATPMSLTTGVGLGALNGILIRGGDALQTAQKLQTVILDKTGTITHGKPVLTDVVTAGGFTGEEIIMHYLARKGAPWICRTESRAGTCWEWRLAAWPWLLTWVA